jgi:hypothetical protein
MSRRLILEFRILPALAWLLLPAAWAVAEPAPRIAWYGTLSSGLEVAQSTGRPILLVSGAPQCHGVPGVW